jgi:hypothetical protein
LSSIFSSNISFNADTTKGSLNGGCNWSLIQKFILETPENFR